jgi:ABC-type multidrug transport system fused ATPase/permease subunit
MGPLTIAGAMTFLILSTGIAAVAAAIVLFGLQSFQFVLGIYIGKARSKLVKFSEERIKTTNEAIQGIRVIKLYAWEIPIESKIQQIRENELKYLKYYHLLKSINTILQFLGPVFVSFTLFLCYFLRGGTLSVTMVYSSYALLNIARLPIALMPQVLLCRL